MDEAKRDYLQQWLTKSYYDLESARRLLEGPNPIFETAVYHCQQSAEKAVKAFLVFHDQEIEKTHDVAAVIGHATTFEPHFASLLDAAKFLTPYAVTLRYPRAVPDPTQEECDQALQAAIDIYTFVLSLLPSETHPKR